MVAIFLHRRVTITLLSTRAGSRVKGMAMNSHVTKMGTMTNICGRPLANLEKLVLGLVRLVLGTIVVMRVPLVAVEIALCMGNTTQVVKVAGAMAVGVEVEEMAIANEVLIAFAEAQVHIVRLMLCLLRDLK